MLTKLVNYICSMSLLAHFKQRGKAGEKLKEGRLKQRLGESINPKVQILSTLKSTF